LIELNTEEIFLHSLEDWISEFVEDKTNGHNAGIPPMIKEGFNCSMHANMDYHKASATALNANGDKKLVVYHI
jgi:hypothetical protein